MSDYRLSVGSPSFPSLGISKSRRVASAAQDSRIQRLSHVNPQRDEFSAIHTRTRGEAPIGDGNCLEHRGSYAGSAGSNPALSAICLHSPTIGWTVLEEGIRRDEERDWKSCAPQNALRVRVPLLPSVMRYRQFALAGQEEWPPVCQAGDRGFDSRRGRYGRVVQMGRCCSRTAAMRVRFPPRPSRIQNLESRIQNPESKIS